MNSHKWPFDIKEAVLLVIDMQRYFSDIGGDKAVHNVKRLIDHFREKERPIIFTRHVHKKDGSDLGILGKWWDEMPVDGTVEAEIDDRVRPLAKEIVITKNRYSAFYNTDLDSTLKKLEIKELVITGVMTNVCCESTARDAFYRDYMVRFVSDATGTKDEKMHTASLLNLAYAFADVCVTNELI